MYWEFADVVSIRFDAFWGELICSTQHNSVKCDASKINNNISDCTAVDSWERYRETVFTTKRIPLKASFSREPHHRGVLSPIGCLCRLFMHRKSNAGHVWNGKLRRKSIAEHNQYNDEFDCVIICIIVVRYHNRATPPTHITKTSLNSRLLLFAVITI